MRKTSLLLALATLTITALHAERIELWNGKDLAGWKIFLADSAADPASVWKIDNGILRLDSKGNGYIRTEKTFSDYRLHLEWRWDPNATPRSNSGVMLHVNGPDLLWPASFEAQLKTGNAGQVVGMGLDIPDAPMTNNRKRAERLSPSSEKPHGEWNTYDILAKGDTIEVLVNNVRQNLVKKLPVTSGAIALQMEGAPIEFRNLWLEPLSAQKSPAPMLTSKVYRWDEMTVTPTPKGSRRAVFDGPTSTLNLAHCHITTLNPGENSGEPTLHRQEEVIIVKEGQVEMHIDGRTETAGPGSVFHLVANAVTRLRNAGNTPATYIVVYYHTPLTPKE